MLLLTVSRFFRSHAYLNVVSHHIVAFCRAFVLPIMSTIMESPPQPPYPLHPSIASLLSPQYVAFYNEHVVNAQQAHYQPLEISRIGGTTFTGSSEKLAVGDTKDINIRRRETLGPEIKIRCFIPHGKPPPAGWPCMIYFHGGGFVLGNLDSESTVCTNLCNRSSCVVITADYRLAPEYPYPAAVEDAWEVVLWTISAGLNKLNLNGSKLAIGGSSAGGNLAAVMTQRALSRKELHIEFKLQLLIVPVTDNTASIDSNPTYKAFEHAAGLSAMKMLWYRNHYLPVPAKRYDSDASPILFSDARFAQLPPAVVIVGEVDVVRHEGEEYANKLKAAGVPTRLEVMKGMPHPFIVMDAVLDEGRRAITILCDSLAQAFR